VKQRPRDDGAPPPTPAPLPATTHPRTHPKKTQPTTGRSKPTKHPNPTANKKTHTKLEEDWVRSNPQWVAELELMLRTRTKAEIQALSSFGFQYLSQVYLPLKLQEGDWI
jgi:DNA topoisomerase VI subunit A